LAQLGLPAAHLTQLGGSFRPAFLELCARDGLDVRWVDSGSDIRFCYTLLEEGDAKVTELVEESAPVSPSTEENILDLFERASVGVGTVVVSGTKAAGFSDRVVPRMTEIAKSRGCRVILDVRGEDLLGSLPFGPDVVKPNLREFLSTYIPDALDAAEGTELQEMVADAAGRVAREAGCSVVLTRGASAVWAHDGRNFSVYDIPTVRPLNTTGSGDAFTAGFAAVWSEGGSLEAAIAEGARCGRLNAGLFRPGVIRS
jgi:1-phosphofructokinase/tagatose 6-phosphate kinase